MPSCRTSEDQPVAFCVRPKPIMASERFEVSLSGIISSFPVASSQLSKWLPLWLFCLHPHVVCFAFRSPKTKRLLFLNLSKISKGGRVPGGTYSPPIRIGWLGSFNSMRMKFDDLSTRL